MTLEEKKQGLLLRAERNLVNTSAITDDAIEGAISDADGIVGSRIIPDYAYFDVAMYRLKILLKINPNETDQKLYDHALKLIRETPLIEDNKQVAVVVINRSNLWL